MTKILGKIDFDFIKENYGKKTGPEIAKFLGVSRQAINSYAHRHGLIKEVRKYNTGSEWTEIEELFLIQNLGKLDVAEIAKKLNRSIWAIYAKKREIKINNTI